MARFTEHGGDPQWLKDQRDAQKRALTTRTPRQQKAFPYPTATSHVEKADRKEFVNGVGKNHGFEIGLILGLVLRGRRR